MGECKFCDGDAGAQNVCDACWRREIRHHIEEQLLGVRVALQQLLTSPDLTPEDRELAEGILLHAKPLPSRYR